MTAFANHAAFRLSAPQTPSDHAAASTRVTRRKTAEALANADPASSRRHARFALHPAARRSWVVAWPLAGIRILLGGFLGMVLGVAIDSAGDFGAPEAWLLLGGSCGLALGVVGVVWGRRLRAQTPPDIALEDEHVTLPSGRHLSQTIQVRYEDVRSVALHGKLVIGTSNASHEYDPARFVQLHGAARLRAELLQRVSRQLGGSEQLETMTRRHEIAALAMPRPIPVTRAVFGIVIAVFALDFVLRVLGCDLKWHAGNAPAQVLEGEWFRLVTANFLHAGLIHLWVNAAAMLFLGRLVERMLGASRFIVVWTASALAGAAASLLFSPAEMSVGASTALFGLLGSLLVINLRYRDELPGGFHRSFAWWKAILVINGALSFCVPAIDGWAHVGGLTAGVIVTLPFCLSRRLPVERPAGAVTGFLATGMVTAFALGFVLAIAAYAAAHAPAT